MSSPRDLWAPVAGLLTLVSVIPYMIDILRGAAKPQRTSWFVFAALASVASISQLSDGACAGAWLTAGAAIGFSAVFVASLRHGVGGFARRDAMALAIALAGLLLWRRTGDPVVALVAIIVVEVGAIALTSAKAYRAPTTETAATWLIDAVAGGAALLGVSGWTFREVAYPIHHVLANLAVLAAIRLGRRRRQPVLVGAAA